MSGPRNEEPNENDLRLAREVALEVWTETYHGLVSANQFEAIVMDEAHDLAEFCVSSDDRTLCILVVSFLEDALKQAFANYWSIESKAELERYFGGNGPLSTFSQRTLAARGQGWLIPESATEMDKLRRIRNAFAHDHRIHSISDRTVKGLAESLAKREQVWCQNKNYDEPYRKASEAQQLRLRLFCACMFTLSECLGQAKLLNAQLPRGFRPGKGWEFMLELERGLTDAAIRHSWRTLGLRYSGATYEYKSDGPRRWEAFNALEHGRSV